MINKLIALSVVLLVILLNALLIRLFNLGKKSNDYEE